MSFQGDSIFWVEVDKIVPNPYQPRREFNESSLQELSESIRMYGILQPLTVSRNEVSREDGTFYSEYELIAGERRLRASKLAGLEQVPVIIREGEESEQEKLELAIIENLQREDLNAVDRALAFRQLADNFGLSHSQVAKKVGRSREYVSNTIRILQLRDYMLESLKVGDISEGHARTLLMLNDRPEEQDTVYREILLKKLSVREVERIARKIATDKVRKKEWKATNPELIEIEKQFTETLGTRVQIQETDFGGKLTIDYFSQDDLEVILGRLRVLEAEKQALEESQEMTEQIENATGLAFSPPVVVPEAPEPQPQLTETDQPAPTPPSTPPEPPVFDTPTPQPQEEPTPPAPSFAAVPPKEPVMSPEPVQPAPQPEVNADTPPQATSSPEEASLTYSEVKEEPEEQEKEDIKRPDDSDLYSMRNFTV